MIESTRISISAFALLAFQFSSPMAHAQSANGEATKPTPAESGLNANPLDGPDSPTSLLRDERDDKADLLDQDALKEWSEQKAALAERMGLSLGADYTAVGFKATDSFFDDKSASGIARFFGSWELLNHGAADSGSLEFKVEYRHSYTEIPPVAFGFAVGYAGTPEPVFNDEGFRTTTFYWKQDFLDDRAVARLGFVDVKEYFDVYALASPWTGFHNLAFSTGVNTMAVLSDGALGGMVGGYLTDNVYAAAGIADANPDPKAVFHGFDTFFGDFDTLKTFEIGVTGGGPLFFVDNAHISFWHLDDIEATGAPGGWGVVGSISTLVDGKWLPFLRAGWADGGGGIYEASVSAGFGFQDQPGGNLLGVGLNWGKPNPDTIPLDLDDQWTSEIFYRVQLTENVQITPSVQLLVDPALDPDGDFVALFGLRARATF